MNFKTLSLCIYMYIYMYVCMYVCVYIYIYIYMQSWKKTMCPPGYHHNGFVLMYLGTRCTVHKPKCMSCYKPIVVTTRRAHCFHDCIYITLILLLWNLNTLCVVDHLWALIYIMYVCMFEYVYSTKLIYLHILQNSV